MHELTVGSLFSGIGGFDLGFERAGMRTVWFCEQDPFCQRVLAKHWPGVPCHPDVRALVADSGDPQPQVAQGDDGEHGQRAAVGRRQLVTSGAGAGGGDRRGADPEGTAATGGDGTRAAGVDGGQVPVPVPHVDLLCGGFPCQDLSLAGKGAGIDGARSGLWSEFARLIGDLRPRYVVVENVPALLGRGAGRVLGDLAAVGYDAEWDCLPASALGAPHRRDRFWLVAYPQVESVRTGLRPDGPGGLGRGRPGDGGGARGVPDSGGIEHQGGPHAFSGTATAQLPTDTEGNGRRSWGTGRPDPSGAREREPVRPLQDPDERALLPWRVGGRAAQAGGPEWWSVEPPVGRVAHGVPDRLDQLAALGNSLVPVIAEFIGRRILEWEEVRAAA